MKEQKNDFFKGENSLNKRPERIHPSFKTSVRKLIKRINEDLEKSYKQSKSFKSIHRDTEGSKHMNSFYSNQGGLDWSMRGQNGYETAETQDFGIHNTGMSLFSSELRRTTSQLSKMTVPRNKYFAEMKPNLLSSQLFSTHNTEQHPLKRSSMHAKICKHRHFKEKVNSARIGLLTPKTSIRLIQQTENENCPVRNQKQASHKNIKEKGKVSRFKSGCNLARKMSDLSEESSYTSSLTSQNESGQTKKKIGIRIKKQQLSILSSSSDTYS